MNLDIVQALIALAAFFLTFAVAILGGMKWMLTRLERRTDERFDRVDQRLDRLEASTDERFAGVDRRFTEVGATLMDVKIALARLEGPHPPFLIARG